MSGSDDHNSYRFTLVLGLILRIVYVVAVCWFCYLGYDLFIKGVTGEVSLVLEAKGLVARITNAAPGLFLMIGSVAVLIFSIKYPPTAKILRGNSRDE